MMSKLIHLTDYSRMHPVFHALACFITSYLLCLSVAHADMESDGTGNASSVVFTQSKRNAIAALENPPDREGSSRTQEPSLEGKTFRTQALIWGGVGTVLTYGATVWWKDGSSGGFRTTNEGWFGQDTYAGGADKLGHAYATYTGTRLLTSAFEWAGNNQDRAIALSATTVFGTLLAVETLDGFSERYKFSKEDLVMNAIGTGLGVLLEKNKRLDDLFDFRLHYWPSGDAKRLNEIGPVGDHSGQTYLLVAKATGMPRLKNHDVLRYFELAVGYASRGYEPNDGAPAPDRRRHLYFGISLNISEILRNTVFSGPEEKRLARRITDTALEYVQVPGTALLADHRL